MDSSEINIQPAPPSDSPLWKPLSAKQRRVLGTLMEKSKTTPDAYPMTFAGLNTGCNQKSNREPVTNYSADQVETIVDELRELGAAVIVQGSGRVTKVRHNGYNWMNLSKTEAAIMTELLLRGEQTLGELRTRASRMEPISDLQTMQQLFDELKRRQLVVELTPSGRGQIVTHNLYPEWELEQLQQRVATKGGTGGEGDAASDPAARSLQGGSASSSANTISALQAEVSELKSLVQGLIDRVSHLEKELGITPADGLSPEA